MDIYGLEKTTLIDFPDHIACTVFTGACNFRCPFCHNPELVQPDQVAKLTPIKELDFFWWLKSRQNDLDGVCITGGEPTIHRDLPDFCRKIKNLGLKVKLDSNGTNPIVLDDLVKNNLIDFIAMDIKNIPEKYAQTTGTLGVNIGNIQKSVEIIKGSHLPYDFRTTVVRGLHTLEDIRGIAEWLEGTNNYSLQNFRNTPKANDPGYLSGKSFTVEELENFRQVLAQKIKQVRVLN